MSERIHHFFCFFSSLTSIGNQKIFEKFFSIETKHRIENWKWALDRAQAPNTDTEPRCGQKRSRTKTMRTETDREKWLNLSWLSMTMTISIWCALRSSVVVVVVVSLLNWRGPIPGESNILYMKKTVEERKKTFETDRNGWCACL